MIGISVPMVGPLRLGGYCVTKIMRLVASLGDVTFGRRVQATPRAHRIGKMTAPGAQSDRLLFLVGDVKLAMRIVRKLESDRLFVGLHVDRARPSAVRRF
jgi:hypothetical protein